MSEKKGKISLAGLGKGSSSSSSMSQFPSFRFSPENEEIHEIMMEDAEDQPDSLPDSPKPGTGGDVSPLKEYILKHKWASWEKRSLSLDLDLKGKLITAIEDKRKSIVSHFIPEEATGVIPSSQSVTEHIGMVTGEENVTYSSANNGHMMSGSQATTTNKQSQQNPISSDCTDLADEFEEIGIDYVAAMGEHGSEDDTFFSDLSFVVPAEELIEHFNFKPQLYQPSCLNLSSVKSTESSHSIDDSVSAYTEPSDEDLFNRLPSPSESPSYEIPGDPDEDLAASSLVKTMALAFLQNHLTKYLIAMLAVPFFVPYGFVNALIFFFSGCFTMIVIHDSWITTQGGAKEEHGIYKKPALVENPSFPSNGISSMDRELPVKLPTRCQAWMTELEGEYDPLTCHLRMTRIVFVRLDGSFLFISYPHPKFRVPKRRLWSDSPLAPEIIFVRHDIYQLTGAKVTICPEKLARKRAWNKKYPILISLPDKSVICKVSPTLSLENLMNSTDPLNPPGHNNHSPQSPTKEHLNKRNKKEINKEDCSFKTLYLFSRTDREKDDWFRRFKAASHVGVDGNEDVNLGVLAEAKLLRVYHDYMKRILPSLDPDKSKPVVDKFDNISIVAFGSGADKVTITKSHPVDTKALSKEREKDSPSSSKKSTPEKEKKDDFSDFGIENFSSVPQSPAFLNAILGRIFFDFLNSAHWKEQVRILIQKKLFYIKKPPFLGELKVTDLDLGCAIPVIHKATSPIIDHHGVWVDLDLAYDGRMVVTLETNINLFKLRKTTSDEDAPGPSSSTHGATTHAASPRQHDNNDSTANPNLDSTMTVVFNNYSNIYDSDADDSGESSESDLDPDEFLANHPLDDKNQPIEQDGNKRGKILRIAERIASSKYMKTRVLKKVVGNLGNTPLILSVELTSLVGTLALNIPPPPTDRLWMGFRGNPNIEMCAKPKVGERAVTFVHVTKWIKRKLITEFQRVMVLPNMNDITIPLMEFKLPK